MVDRESARSLAQKQRHLEITTSKPRNPCEGPKFSEPVRTNVEDKNISSILGSFNKIKNVMEPSHMNNFLGIPKEPPTPDEKLRLLFDATSAPNGQVKSNKLGNHAGSGSSLHRDQSGTRNSVPHLKNGQKSHEMTKTSVKQEQQTSKMRPGGSSVSPQVPLVKDGSQKGKIEDTKLNVKKEKDLHSKTSSSSKVRPSGSSDSNSKSLPKDSTTPTKVKSASATDTKPSLSCSKKDSRRPNGIINHRQSGQTAIRYSETGLTPVKQESVKTEPDHSSANGDKASVSVVTKNLFRDSPEKTTHKKPDLKKEKPKLNIPLTMGSLSEPNNLDVEKILSMMTENKSPLTAIQNTPIKGDASSKFHFLPNTPIPKASERLPVAPPDTKPDPDKLKQDTKVKPNSPKAPSPGSEKKSSVKAELADDLRISEDESEAEEPQTAKKDLKEQNSQRHSGTMDASRLSDSSSGSSSCESDDDSSSGNDTDSESDASSSDHEASPPPSPQPQEKTKSYNLHDLINRIRKSPGALNAAKQPSLGNPTAATSTPATPPTLTVKDSQTFPNTNQHRTTVVAGRKVEGSGGFVLGINDLTTTLTPPEDYAKGNFNSYDTSNSINDFSKLLPGKRTPLSKSPVRTGGSGSKQSASKRSMKKDLDKSPLASKSKVNSQTKIEVSSKESKKDSKSVKLNKQSSKSGAESKAEVKLKSGKTTPKGEKKTPPRVRTPEKKSAKKPTSKKFVSDSDSSDSEDEIERTPSSKKINGTSKPHAVSSPAHKHNAHQTEMKCKSSNKANRTKEKHNSLKGDKEAVLDDVFSSMIGPRGDGLFSEPLLSPIKNEESERPVSTSHPPEITYKDGIPSLIVKLNLSLINRVPRQPCRTERTSPEHSCSALEKNKLEEFGADSLPPLVKAGKRKQGDDDEETAVKESSCKKPKIEKCAKSSRPAVAEESEPNELSSLPETDTVLDRRRPLERRSSTNSVSSLMSSNSSCSSSRKSDHETQPSKRQKKTTGDSMDSSCSNSSAGTNADGLVNIKGHKWGSPPPQTEERADRSQDSMSVLNDVTCTRNGHRSASEEWGDYVRNSDQHVGRKNAAEVQRIGLQYEESRQCTADSYLAEGKKLKRQADAQNDKNVKVLMYFDAVLSFILCGNSMENDPIVPDEKASTMYSETCDIIKFILKFQGSHLSQDALSMDKKLAVLCHRCQGLLYMKMFKMKKAAGLKFGRILGEHFKNSKTQQTAQTPSSWSSSKYTGTPSPMSPTPSPGSVGSVCSLGSQGSNNGDLSANALQPSSLPQAQPPKLTNGMPHIMASPASVSVPQRIVNMMSTFIQNSSYGYFGLEHWEQADILAQENIEFFRELDSEFGTLTLHSSTLDLVRYARLGLRKLKNS